LGNPTFKGIYITKFFKPGPPVKGWAERRMMKQIEEEWMPIIDSDNAYISNFGNVSRDGKKVIPKEDSEGYLRVNVGGKLKRDRVHRLVAKAFIDNPKYKPFVNHIDGNKKNNRVDNLEWVTPKENAVHASEHDLLSHDTGRKGYILAVNVKNGQSCVFLNQAHVAKVIGADDSEVNKCIKGKRKTVHGYTLEYIANVR